MECSAYITIDFEGAELTGEHTQQVPGIYVMCSVAYECKKPVYVTNLVRYGISVCPVSVALTKSTNGDFIIITPCCIIEININDTITIANFER